MERPTLSPFSNGRTSSRLGCINHTVGTAMQVTRLMLLSCILICTDFAGAGAAEQFRAFELEAADSGYRLALRHRPMPDAGKGQVVVRMRAASLNRRDLLILDRSYGEADVAGRVPLSDGAGEIVAIGPDVAGLQRGDRVVGTFFERWISGPLSAEVAASARGGENDGMLAEYVVTDASGLLTVPGYLSFEEAATLPCAAVTAWNALFTRGRLKAGDTVLLEGTGGVSIFGLQLAAAAGARPIITSSRDAKLDHARLLGAVATINYRRVADWDGEVLRLTDGHGADHVLEVGGQDTLPKALAALAWGGHVAIIGGLSGWAPAIPTPALMRKSASVSGIYVGSREDFSALLAFMQQHELRPVIDRVFDFEDAPAAYAYLASGEHLGKVVIRMP